MKKRRLTIFLASALFAGAALAETEQRLVKVEGYVLDSACAFVKDVKKPMGGGKCALECAKAGSPLIVLADDGTIYWPISDTMPASGQNARLMEYAGKKVVAQGKAYQRGGSHALVIEKIEAKAEPQ